MFKNPEAHPGEIQRRNATKSRNSNYPLSQLDHQNATKLSHSTEDDLLPMNIEQEIEDGLNSKNLPSWFYRQNVIKSTDPTKDQRLHNEKALRDSARCNNLVALSALLDSGVDIDCRSRKRRNALMAAAAEGNLEAVKLLVDRGANVNHTDIYGNSVLISAMACDNLDVSKYLIEKGAKIDHINNFGNTVLSIAVHFKELEAIKLLVDKGADVKHSNKTGTNALDLAKFYNRPSEIVDFLTHSMSMELSNFYNSTDYPQNSQANPDRNTIFVSSLQ